jgi:hypothetical protein
VPRVYLPKDFCIELNGKGLPLDSTIQSLIDQALKDSAPGIDMERFGPRPLKFYKAKKVPGSNYIYLVFFINGWDDLYMVYRGDPRRAKIASRSPYGSLHYRCSAALVRDGGV